MRRVALVVEWLSLLLALVAPLTWVGCAVTPTAHTARRAGPGDSGAVEALENLAGGEWRVASLRADGKEFPVASEARPTFAVDETGKVHGLATLNRYFGRMELGPGGQVRWGGPFGSTRMAGPEHLMDQETRFLRALQGATKAFFREGALVLEDDGGDHGIELRR